MIGAALESAWHFVFGWPTVAVVVGMIAVAVAVLEPKQIDAITDLRKWAIVVAVIAFSFTAIAGKFYDDGLSEKQRQWTEALKTEASNGEADRAAAVSSEPVSPTDRGVFRDDIYNRDGAGAVGIKPKGPVRWLAAHHLFGKR